MKITKFILTIFSILLYLYSSAQDDMVKEIGLFYKNVKVIKYQFVYKGKDYDENDTTILLGSVIQQFIHHDSTLSINYNIKIDCGDKYVKNQIERINFIQQYNSFKRSSYSLGIRSVDESSALNEIFFGTISALVDSNELNYFIVEKDTIVDGIGCLKLIQRRQISNFNGYLSCVFLIEKSTNKLVFYKSFLNLGNITNYEEMSISSMEFFDSISKDTFSIKAFSSKYGTPVSIDSLIKIDDNKNVSIGIGTTLKSIVGKSNLNSFNIDTFNFGSQITILDLWYMSCPPCIKAIPYLNEIQNKFSKKGVKVLGINNKDSGKDTSIINNFIRKKSIAYEIILVNSLNFKPIQTSFFPTLLILDKKGTIRYIKQGFYDDMNVQIENEINKLLNE